MAEQRPSLNDILSQYALKETDLSIKCPREVRNEIAIKLDDWKMIGYSLGFPKEKLTSIGHENETQDLCKVALLDSWSKREGEGASYLRLADALYRRQRRDLVEFLCKLLIASRCSATQSAEMDRRQRTTSSTTDSEAVATRSRTTTGLEETFKCPCGECSLMVYLKNGCPKSRIPYLGMPVNLSVGDKRNLKYALNKDTRKLCESFEHLSNSTCDSLIARNIKLDRLIRVAKIHDKSLQLSSVQSVDEAFTILAESMSFFNHKLLAIIIKQLGDECDKQRLVKYSEEFDLYCKRKIFEVDPDTWEGSERLPEALEGRQLFAVVVSGSMIETLGDTELVLETLADVLDIQPAALHIHRIDEGSVILVFSVPSCIADEIFPLPQEKITLLKAKGIMIFFPSISKPQNLESNRAPPIQPSRGDFGAGLSRLHISLDSGFISRTSTGVVSTSLGPSSYGGLEMDKVAQLTQGAADCPEAVKAIQLEEVIDQKLDLLKDQQMSTREKGDSSLWQLSSPPVKMVAELRDNRAKIAEYEQQLARANEEIAAWRDDCQAKAQQVMQYSKQVDQFRVLADRLTAELRESRAKIAEFEQQLARANEEIAALEEIQSKLDDKYREKEAHLEKALAHKSDLEDQLQKSRADHERYVSQAENQLQQLQPEGTELRQQIIKANEEIAVWRDECLAKTQQVKQYSKQVDHFRVQVDSLRAEVRDKRAKITEYEHQLGYYQKQIRQFNDDYEQKVVMMKAQFEAEMLNMARDLEILRREKVMWEMTRQAGDQQQGQGGDIAVLSLTQPHQYTTSRDGAQDKSITSPGGQQGGGTVPDSSPHQAVHRYHGNQQNPMPQHGMGNIRGASIGMEPQQQLGVATQESGHQRVPSGPQENPLLQGINTAMHNVAATVGREVDNYPELQPFSPQAPFDPNLICPMCRQQFRIGEIQKYRQHVQHCHGT